MRYPPQLPSSRLWTMLFNGAQYLTDPTRMDVQAIQRQRHLETRALSGWKGLNIKERRPLIPILKDTKCFGMWRFALWWSWAMMLECWHLLCLGLWCRWRWCSRRHRRDQVGIAALNCICDLIFSWFVLPFSLAISSQNRCGGGTCGSSTYVYHSGVLFIGDTFIFLWSSISPAIVYFPQGYVYLLLTKYPNII